MVSLSQCFMRSRQQGVFLFSEPQAVSHEVGGPCVLLCSDERQELISSMLKPVTETDSLFDM